METIDVTRSNGVVTVAINRPSKKNAATHGTWLELAAAFRAIQRNTDDRVVVVTGAGGDFCAGADLWGDSDAPSPGLGSMRDVGEAALALHRLPQPTIAKVRGVAVGAGCNLAFGCDLVVASDTARFSEIFSRRGLSLDFGGSWALARRVPIHVAKELAFFGEILNADSARELGLVNRIVPDGELDDFVDDWAQRLVKSPPIALAMTKRLLHDAYTATMEQALEAEGFAQTVNFGTKDTAEALRAFAEKRDPNYIGR